jgi:hypothetical protein
LEVGAGNWNFGGMMLKLKSSFKKAAGVLLPTHVFYFDVIEYREFAVAIFQTFYYSAVNRIGFFLLVERKVRQKREADSHDFLI